MTMGVETIETTIETTAIMTVEMITVTIRKRWNNEDIITTDCCSAYTWCNCYLWWNGIKQS